MMPRTLVIGSGDCAARVAEMLISRGAHVVVAGANAASGNEATELAAIAKAEGFELITPARMISCQGFAGRFETLFEIHRQKLRRTVATIIVAEDCQPIANFDQYGLCPTPRIRSLSDFGKLLQETRDPAVVEPDVRSVLFLDGLIEDGFPFLFERTLRSALAVQAQPGARTVVLSANLKVAGDGLEALYRRAKQAGTLFFKFTQALPTIRQQEDGGATVTFTDETTGHTYSLTPELTVVDECWMPSEYQKHLGAVLRLHTDRRGFLQADNVHRTTVLTNRRGILVCGLSRRPMGPPDFATDAAEAVNAVFHRPRDGEKPAAATAHIDKARCIRCLTCYRLCPHRSIQESPQVAVISDACEGCGICAAECPRGAIGLGTEADREKCLAHPTGLAGALVAFCCSRSAARAKQLAERHRLALPRNLKIVEVPCAGALSTRHILDALGGGAGGVLVLTCHPGNCHSEQGYMHARRRAALVTEQLKPLSAMVGRIEIHSLAANMAVEFVEVVHRFAQKIVAMTPDWRN